MTKRHHHILAAMLLPLSLIAGCDRLRPDCPAAAIPEGLARVSVNVTTSYDAEVVTRATVSPYLDEFAWEGKVKQTYWAVFNATGVLEHSVTTGEDVLTPGELWLRTGAKTIWAVSNAPGTDWSSCRTLDEFESAPIQFSDNRRGECLVQAVRIDCEVVGGKANSFSAPLRRIASRVVVRRVQNSERSGEGMFMMGAHIGNAVSQTTLSGHLPAGTSWLNRFGRARDYGKNDYVMASSLNAGKVDSPELLSHIFGTGPDNPAIRVENGNATPGSWICGPLYFFPNETVTGPAGWSSTFSPRPSRLVMTIAHRSPVISEVAGNFYVFDLNAESGSSYTYSLIVEGVGSKDPDVPSTKTIDVGPEVDDDDDEEIDIKY